MKLHIFFVKLHIFSVKLHIFFVNSVSVHFSVSHFFREASHFFCFNFVVLKKVLKCTTTVSPPPFGVAPVTHLGLRQVLFKISCDFVTFEFLPFSFDMVGSVVSIYIYIYIYNIDLA